MDQAIARFLAHIKHVQDGAKNTILAYHTDLTQFRKVLEKRELEPQRMPQLGPQQISAYLEWLEEREFQPATVARKLAALRSFLHYLHEYEAQQVDELLDDLQAPKPPAREPKVLSPEEVKRLLRAPSNSTAARDMRDAAILSLLYSTGLRAEEAVQVQVHDIDLKRGVLDREGAKTDPLPLRRSYHRVERYVKEGRPQLLRKRAESALFLNQRGEGLTRQGLWLVVKRWASACNLGEDVSPYTLRHSLTRHMLESGRSKQEVQEVLGLSSGNSLRRHVQAVSLQ